MKQHRILLFTEPDLEMQFAILIEYRAPDNDGEMALWLLAYLADVR